MSKNPIMYALAALAYIVLLVTGIFYAPHVVEVKDSIFIPITMLSLFVFSAAVMAYLFMYEPLVLLLEGKRREALTLFGQTLVAFAVCAALLVSGGFLVTAQF